MTNLAAFERLSERLLAHLVEVFPVPSSLTLSELGLEESNKGTWDPVTETMQGGDAETDDEINFDHVVNWLLEEGYIRGSKSKIAGFYGLVLTSKGLDLMGIKPKSLSRR
ncbi:hypothetical protein CWR53_03345 [Pseudomonas sp. SGAir0191]|uniref:hypothetical protein n=1 Tax=Pseudomonas sp. SGAir0191 TaxID=2217867 RepID=UPI000C2C09A2|nr:hypothetical protein [Pseudomonas sp. SGAir0191]AUA31696.1 hypothetical protein CWR53_03345 [Pseudomonas sp. SGAir0191]